MVLLTALPMVSLLSVGAACASEPGDALWFTNAVNEPIGRIATTS
jgi:hypothetical protein